MLKEGERKKEEFLFQKSGGGGLSKFNIGVGPSTFQKGRGG